MLVDFDSVCATAESITDRARLDNSPLFEQLDDLSTELRMLRDQYDNAPIPDSGLRRVEDELRFYPTLISWISKGKPEWWARAYDTDVPPRPPDCERVDGGCSVSLAQKLVETQEWFNDWADKEISKVRDRIVRIRDAVLSLPSPMQELVELRYWKSLNWYDISAELGYDRRHCLRLRDEALTEISQYL